MLATLAALQLLALAQGGPADPAPPPPEAEEGKLPEDPGAAQPPPTVNPPLPRKRGAPPPTGSTDAAQAPEEATPPPGPVQGTLPPPRLRAISPGQLSLLSAEPLGGGSAALVHAGWPSLGILYAQGITREDDLGAFLDLDWAKTELRLGGFYRRPLGPAGPFRMAGRLGVAWYADFGGEWIYGDNSGDRGFEVTPGLSFSRSGAGGVFSAIGEAPVTVTVWHGGGVLFSPRVKLSYETPLFGEYTVGVQGGLGYRAGAGDAPLRDGRAELTFLVLGGYRVF